MKTGEMIRATATLAFRVVEWSELKAGDEVFHLRQDRPEQDAFAHGPMEVLDPSIKQVKLPSGYPIKLSGLTHLLVRV